MSAFRPRLPASSERSVIKGTDVALNSSGWEGKVGPRVALRTNASHVLGATRIDWGIDLSVTASF